MEAKTKPVKHCTLGNVAVAVWKNQSQNGNDWFQVDISKRYRDESGDWKNSNRYRDADIPVLKHLLDEALTWLRMQEAPTSADPK